MADLISSGVELMLAGMGIVYMFLVMLVFAIHLMSAVVQRYFPDRTAIFRPLPEGMDKATVAAITAAVHQYRNKHR